MNVPFHPKVYYCTNLAILIQKRAATSRLTDQNPADKLALKGSTATMGLSLLAADAEELEVQASGGLVDPGGVHPRIQLEPLSGEVEVALCRGPDVIPRGRFVRIGSHLTFTG